MRSMALKACKLLTAFQKQDSCDCNNSVVRVKVGDAATDAGIV